MSAPREWTLSNVPYGYDQLAAYIADGEELADDETVEVVEKSALVKAEADLEEAVKLLARVPVTGSTSPELHHEIRAFLAARDRGEGAEGV